MKAKFFSKTLCIILTFSFFTLCVGASKDEAFSWYCKRNKEHLQPTVDSNMAFIEDYGGFYVDRSHGDNSKEKVVYLTFDAGYENGNIEKILDIMKNEGVTGAFFILGNLIKSNPELVIRMRDEGHIVANHTSSHRDVTKIKTMDEFETELNELENLYFNTTGSRLSRYYRPPEGRFNVTSMKYANELGYKTIFWSLAYADWDNTAQPSADYAKKKIYENIHNGAIILLHPTSSTNANILTDVIRQLKSEGYSFGSLDDL